MPIASLSWAASKSCDVSSYLKRDQSIYVMIAEIEPVLKSTSFNIN